MCLGASVKVWQADINKFFPRVFVIHQFYKTEYLITDLRCLKTFVSLWTIKMFNTIYSKLDPNNPNVSLNTFNKPLF